MELRDLEGEIGLLPWGGAEPDPKHLKLIAQWLLLKGMPQGKIDNLRPNQMLSCYATRNYFEVVIGNRPRKVDYKTDRIMGRSLMEPAPSPAQTYLGIEPPNTAPDYEILEDKPKDALSSMDWQSLRDNIYRDVLSSVEIKIDRNVSTALATKAEAVQNNIVHKFNSGELKIQFSDQAKADLKSLVLTTATDFLAQNLPAKEIIVKFPDKNLTTNVGHVHHAFPDLLKALSCKLHVMLVGMASSSKTTSARIASEALGLNFYHMGAAASEFKFAGYQDGNGTYHPTPFRLAFEHGGVILLDEYDGSIPAATMFIQAALANGTCHFPDRIVEMHPDFVCIAACNTYGRGSDRQYVGRNQQDAANMDRFVVLDWDIDEDLEAQIFGDGRKNWTPESSNYIKSTPEFQTMSCGDWVRRVQKIRHSVVELGERHLVTMRASDFGGRLLQAGMSLDKVEQMCVWKGLNPATVEKIRHHASL